MQALQIAIDKLVATPAVTAITTAKRIYPVILPQTAAPPCLLLNIAGTTDERMLTGAGKYYLSRVSVACLAETADGVLTLGNAVLAALQDNVNATIGSFTGVSTSFANFELSDYSDDRSLYRRILDFHIRYRS